MRVFFAISRDRLDKYSLDVPRAHAVTDGLRQAFADDDDEELDMIALLAAADDNIREITGEPFRLVVAADAKAELADDDSDPSLVVISEPIPWTDVAAVFADEAEASDDVIRAREGDDDAFDRLAGIDLLWYDPTERLRLSAELARRMA